MSYPVVWFEVMGRDAKALRGYYGELFGWKFNVPYHDYGMVEAAEGGIPGGVGPAPDGKGWTTFYVATPDPQAMLDKAVAMGGEVRMPVTEMPDVTVAMFADPEGHIVGLVKSE